MVSHMNVAGVFWAGSGPERETGAKMGGGTTDRRTFLRLESFPLGLLPSSSEWSSSEDITTIT